jgi:hypothetical protein
MKRARMVIEIQLGSTPIGGSLFDCAEVAHGFSGWMEFASVLQAAIDAAAHAGEQTSARPEMSGRWLSERRATD